MTTTSAPGNGWRKLTSTISRRSTLLGVLGLVAILSVATVFAGVPVLAMHGAPAAPSGHAAPLVTAAVRTHAMSHPSGSVTPNVASGRGTFFTTAALPYGTTPACFGYACDNTSFDPSIVYTSTGVLGTAYTLYTNASPCANVSNYATSEIAFSTSTNTGATWSSPTILGNTNCALANQYADAWEPSLAALSNGTLVLAFVMFNMSQYSYPYEAEFGSNCAFCYNIYWAALAVTESYDGGVTWTAPTVLNASANPNLDTSAFLPNRPWVATFGDTVYVTWMNSTVNPNYYSAYASTQVHLLVSTNGGSTWGSPIDLPNEVSQFGENAGMNPYAMVSPSGELYIAYVTNWTYWNTYPSGCSATCIYSIQTANVVVASSTNNGSSFSSVDVAQGVGDLDYYHSYYYQSFSENLDPAPQLAWNPVSGGMYAVWSEGMVQPVCNIYGYCYGFWGDVPQISTSMDGGATWSTPHNITNQWGSEQGTNAWETTVGVEPNGVVDVMATFINYTQGDRNFEGYTNSSDDGATFSPLLVMGNNTTMWPNSPFGEYSSMVNAGGTMLYAYPLLNSTYSYPYFPYGGVQTTVAVSQIYAGAGVTLTFSETGLASGIDWGISVQGNLRNASAPTNLVVSGVPPSTVIDWTVDPVSAGYGTRFSSTSTITSPASFATSTTIAESYSEQVLVNISTEPNYPSCVPYPGYCPYPSWNYTYEMAFNYNITPGPQAAWVALNTPYTVNITPTLWGIPYCPFCTVDYTELGFISWIGNGAGSINTTAQNISLVATGPINETASFYIEGTCSFTPASSSTPVCDQLNQTLLFHETGLPANVPWSVTAQSSLNGVSATATSSSPTIAITSNATLGIVNYTVWSIPDPTTGLYWVGTGSPVSPVLLPSDRVVDIAFALEDPSLANFGIAFQASGLPNATAWSLDVGTSSWGLQTASTMLSLSGGSYAMGAPDVYLTNGTSYYAQSILLVPYVVNGTNSTYSTLPATIALNGPALVIVNFAPEYWLGISASVGGSTGPDSQWVHASGALTLTETADPGYYFVGWTGSGFGAYSGTSTGPTVHPGGPVTELATFSVVPASLWSVTVSLGGVAPGATVSFTLGAQNYSVADGAVVANLATGDYAIGVPYSYLNSSDLTRFVPTGWTSSYTSPSAGMVTIDTNGTLTLNYGTQYLASLSSSSGGTISPAPGTYWWDAGAMQTLTATPDAGQMFVGWSGTQSSTSASLSVTPNAPVNLTAQFGPKPPAIPATYSLAVTESGLPTGLSWSVAVGTTGASGTGATLTVYGLNGTYPISVPNAYQSGGVRYILNGTVPDQSVSTNSTLTVSFAGQYLVTVAGGIGGSVTPGTAWIAQGSSVILTAAPSTGYSFVGWTGTGGGSFTGTDLTKSIMPTAGVNETATFAPIYQQQSSGSSTDGLPLAIGILIGLLVVGLVVGIMLGRRRPPAPSASSSESAPEAPSADGSEGTVYGEGPSGGGGDT